MNNIDLNKINWAQGLNRLYNAVWAVAGIITLIHLVTGSHIDAADWGMAAIMVGGVPFAVKKTLVWIIQGFVK